MDSRSSTDELAGFRLRRELGRGPSAVVYEATQVSLNRRVAFKLFEPGTVDTDRLRRLYWPEHRSAVSLYAAGVCERGPFLAMQLVEGTTLAELRHPRSARPLLADVASALDAAHDAGSVHGGVCARNVLVDRDGHALLTDFGLGHEAASQRSDREAFAALVSEYTGGRVPDPLPPSCAEIVAAAPLPRRRRSWVVAAVVAASAAVVIVAVRGGRDAQRTPAPLPGATVLGSALAAGRVEAVDCAGRSPSAGSAPCTLAQTALAGRTVVPGRGGVIRRWAVRDARGEIALQVLRARGSTYSMAARSPFVRISDSGMHVFPANLPLRAGDLIALELTPGASVGTRSVPGAATARWFGPLEVNSRPPDERLGFERELMLRVEYVAGEAFRPSGRLTGAAAATAPSGRVLRRYDVRPGLTAAVARVGHAIVIDAFTGASRVERLAIADLDPAGELVSLGITLVRHGEPILRLEWRNPDGVVAHLWTAGPRSLSPLG